jgi:hypothetical protein
MRANPRAQLALAWLELEIVAEAADGDELSPCAEHAFDIASDIRMPGRTGLAALEIGSRRVVSPPRTSSTGGVRGGRGHHLLAHRSRAPPADRGRIRRNLRQAKPRWPAMDPRRSISADAALHALIIQGRELRLSTT